MTVDWVINKRIAAEEYLCLIKHSSDWDVEWVWKGKCLLKMLGFFIFFLFFLFQINDSRPHESHPPVKTFKHSNIIPSTLKMICLKISIMSSAAKSASRCLTVNGPISVEYVHRSGRCRLPFVCFPKIFPMFWEITHRSTDDLVPWRLTIAPLFFHREIIWLIHSFFPNGKIRLFVIFQSTFSWPKLFLFFVWNILAREIPWKSLPTQQFAVRGKWRGGGRGPL